MTTMVIVPSLSHDHPPLGEGAHPCEYGLIARCARCRRHVAPCTSSPTDAREVMAGRFVCAECRPDCDPSTVHPLTAACEEGAGS